MAADPGLTRFPHLLSPLKLRQTTLRNRVIRGSMHTRLDMEENGLHKMAAAAAHPSKICLGLS